MTEKEIITEVEHYLSDTSYNYAVMIDGDWGCGKTYFVKNGMFNAIDSHDAGTERHRTPKYISLYGIKTVSEIQDAIVFALAEEILDQKDAPKKREEKAGAGRKLLTSSWKIAKAIRDIKGSDINLYELVGNWLKLEGFVFIFDDIERCDCPLNEVFGFINGLVEHESIKVILVANEKEIRINKIVEQKELQYLAAVNEHIIFPKAINAWKVESETVPLTPEEVERRRKVLFPEGKADEDFKRIREKLIGVTLHFQPEIKEICRGIVRDTSFDSEIKGLIQNKIDFFCATMRSAGHLNLRTFQFFISKFKKIIESISDLDIPSEHKEAVMNKVISDSFLCAVHFKANTQPPEKEIEKIVFSIELEKRFKALQQYVETGELDLKLLQKEINCFIEENLRDLIPANDPYRLLQHEYFMHSQKWCEEKMARVLEKLSKNEYPIAVYGEIIETFQIYESMGFDFSYLDKAKAFMLINISVSECSTIPKKQFYITEETSAVSIHVKGVLYEIDNAIMERNTASKDQSIMNALKEADWVNSLNQIVEQSKLNEMPNKCVFSAVDSNVWLNLLKTASPKTLSRFRQFFNWLYPTKIIRQVEPRELVMLDTIAKGIEPDNKQDLIVKSILRYLKQDIENVCSLYGQS